ncbi:MAG: sulfatase-like hydrolase/transferase [Bacteroides sp.]|nr:sulfatase-like hydrolase/transferase [Bacteroides sp.]
MKKAPLRFVTTYILFVIVFMLQKPLFMLFYHKLFDNIGFTDYLSVMWHGLPLDLASAGYLTAIPGLLLIASLWMIPQVIRPAFKGYFAITSFLIAIIFSADIILYSFWGFRLDNTPLFYFFSSPGSALASDTWLFTATAIIVTGILTWLLYKLFIYAVLDKKISYTPPRKRGKTSLLLLFLTALLFIPIRGGFTVSTTNLSKVYYSNNMYLNHAAINPFFSLLESFTRERNFGEQYRFMTPEKADEVFEQIKDHSFKTDSLSTNTIAHVITTQRPNIIFVVLESFISKVIEPLGGIPDVAVNLDKLAEKGVLFTNFYANSFRTDRGLVSIFSGYPAQPTTSIIKYPKKTQSLPSIPLSLKEKAGYTVDYYYGGDDSFTNMRAYLQSMGIRNIISDVDFPISERLSKWGAHDHVVFNRLKEDLKEKQEQPFMKIIQTSSSHEPFEVPYSRLEDPFLNSVAYADSCLGDFVNFLKQTEFWDNSLIVLVPDHAKRYPDDIPDISFERFQIPLVFAGGAVKDSLRIETYGSQIDIAATLLSQLNIPHDDFAFSKNVLNEASPHFGFFTFPNVFGMTTPDNKVIYDCESNKIIETQEGSPNENVEKGKALLQKLFDDLDAR